jgi:hypothetical protein
MILILRFFIAFWVIDLVGYLPGTIAQRRRPGRLIAPIFHHLYNFTHNWWTLAAAIAVWWTVSGPEWAMLALPLHLAGDQLVLGNFRKPIDRPFEVRG